MPVLLLAQGPWATCECEKCLIVGRQVLPPGVLRKPVCTRTLIPLLLPGKLRLDVFEFRYGSNIGQGPDQVAVAG